MKRDKPINIKSNPAAETMFGTSDFRKKMPPNKAKTTSLDCVASTAASSLELDAKLRAKRKIQVAKTPENNAIKAVFIICDELGTDGCIINTSTTHKGKDPKVISSTLLKTLFKSGDCIHGTLL